MTDRLPIWPPVPGYYQMRLTKGGVFVPVFIWYGAPIIDGEELDRSPRWCVEIDSKTCRADFDDAGELIGRVPIEIERAWPYCARWPISEAEFEFLKGRAAWAREHEPNHPAAVPRETVDLLKLKPIF